MEWPHWWPFWVTNPHCWTFALDGSCDCRRMRLHPLFIPHPSAQQQCAPNARSCRHFCLTMTPCSFTASRQEGRSERERRSPGQYVYECVSIQGRVALLITVVLSLLRKPSRNGDSVSTVLTYGCQCSRLAFRPHQSPQPTLLGRLRLDVPCLNKRSGIYGSGVTVSRS